MGRRASHSALEPKDDPQPGHQLHAILHGLWFQGYPPNRPQLWSAEGQGIHEQGAEASLEDAMDQLNEAHDVALLCLAKY